MNKLYVTCCAFAIVFSSSTCLLAVPSSSDTKPQFESVADRSGNSRSRVRRYRSYSIQPGAAAEGIVKESPTGVPVYSTPSSPRRDSKPSYMRGDSKARGRFGQ